MPSPIPFYLFSFLFQNYLSIQYEYKNHDDNIKTVILQRALMIILRQY